MTNLMLHSGLPVAVLLAALIVAVFIHLTRRGRELPVRARAALSEAALRERHLARTRAGYDELGDSCDRIWR